MSSDPEPRLCRLYIVPEFVELAGVRHTVNGYAVVRPIAPDLDDPDRELVLVIDGAGDLESGHTVTVDRDRLLTLDEARARLAAREPAATMDSSEGLAGSAGHPGGSPEPDD